MSFRVSEASGPNANMRSGLKRACEEFCDQIPFKGRIPTDDERENLNKEAVARLADAYPQYNVMVVLTKHDHHFKDCTHIQLEFSLGPYTQKLDVYVFKSGDFTLRGDGGFINWCFDGNSHRDGKKVKFFER